MSSPLLHSRPDAVADDGVGGGDVAINSLELLFVHEAEVRKAVVVHEVEAAVIADDADEGLVAFGHMEDAFDGAVGLTEDLGGAGELRLSFGPVGVFPETGAVEHHRAVGLDLPGAEQRGHAGKEGGAAQENDRRENGKEGFHIPEGGLAPSLPKDRQGKQRIRWAVSGF